jgi:hypothetical protein
MPMQSKFEMVKDYLMDLGIAIVREDPEEEMVVVSDPENGIHNLVIDCEDPILIMEQLIMEVPEDPKDLFENLLKMNRALVHGAFALDESGKKVIFRDTLQLDNLDLNELEASIDALSMGLAEFGGRLLEYVKN